MAISQSQPTKRRAVITGIGAVTPLAPDLDDTVEQIRRRVSAIAPVRRFDARGCRSDRAAEIVDLDARPFFRAPKSIKLTDDRTRFAVAAAAMALRDAQFADGALDPERAGVIIGSSGSDLQVEDLGRALRGSDSEDPGAFGRHILSGLNPLWLLVNLPNMVSAHISIQFDLRGPNSTVMTDWIAGVQAIGEAASWIEQEEADVVLTGGADCGVLPFVLSDYEQAGLLEPADADAFVAGDGAAVFVLEEREHAVRRGARVYGEIVSSAIASSAGTENSLALSMQEALDRAAWPSRDVSLLSPAWVPHLLYRDLERAATAAVFGRQPLRVVPSNRPALGFALAAASAIDIAIHLKSNLNGERETMLANSLGFLTQAATLCIAREASA